VAGVDGGRWDLALSVCVLPKGAIFVTWMALRDAKPKDRAEIIRASAELFRRRK